MSWSVLSLNTSSLIGNRCDIRNEPGSFKREPTIAERKLVQGAGLSQPSGPAVPCRRRVTATELGSEASAAEPKAPGPRQASASEGKRRRRRGPRFARRPRGAARVAYLSALRRGVRAKAQGDRWLTARRSGARRASSLAGRRHCRQPRNLFSRVGRRASGRAWTALRPDSLAGHRLCCCPPRCQPPSTTMPRLAAHVCALLLAATLGGSAGFSNPNLRGDSIKCVNEGQLTHVPGISDDPCITCKCQNSVVQCGRETCPLPRGCYFLQQAKGNKCCDVCKGCVYNGRVYSSSEEWTDPHDPCRRFLCQSGVITESRIYCHINCKNPRPPPDGQCCPYCDGCLVNGRQYLEGDAVPSDERDPCVVCTCKDGRVTCTKKSCPVLPCPYNRIAQTPETCCPECRGGKRSDYLNGKCLIGQEVFDHAATWPYDQCTNCECQNGTTVCQRTVCPPLQCPPEHQVASAGSCCSECRRPEEKKAMCYYNNQKYYNGDTWKLKKCTKCSCHHGVVRCGVEECITAPVCPPKKKLVTPPGKCCPTCVEEDGICTVFGDPHYKTFDGKIFNYQGPCRYVLASDCSGGTFSIEVWNDVRYSKSFSWTKSVVIRVKDMKVKLGQFLRVRIKKERIKLPFVKLRVLNILQEDHNIVVRINKGVKVVWDGDNYVEVSVSPTYKGKLCGLCGNYNDKQDDDFMSRNGTRLTDPNAFGNSWLVGRRKKCLRPPKRPSHPLDCRLKDWSLRLQNLQNCNNIKQGSFKLCHKAVEATPYFRSCMLDMCECLPSDKCYCDSLNAYARECSRAGIQIDWKNSTNCQGMHCPRSSYYTTCGPPCRRTCKNYQQARPCRRKCQPGCQCNPGRVWHRDRCVLPSECPLPTS